MAGMTSSSLECLAWIESVDSDRRIEACRKGLTAIFGDLQSGYSLGVRLLELTEASRSFGGNAGGSVI